MEDNHQRLCVDIRHLPGSNDRSEVTLDKKEEPPRRP
jgi:hypothetical protein